MTLTPDPTAILLPDGTRLVHIGPHKTGTTAVQNAFHAGREAVSRQGVRYAGPRHQAAGPALAVTGRARPGIGTKPSIWTWRFLVREIRRAREPRVVISSEYFADAHEDAVRTIVRDLDPTRVHIAITLRPLARILPSQWQQWVQGGLRASYHHWLDSVLDDPYGTRNPRFWHQHRHDQLVARWAEVVGPQNLTVIALDDRDQAMVLRVFERLVGLEEGTLVVEPEFINRSMTLPEVEVVRAFNESFKSAGLPDPLHAQVMRLGAALYMKSRVPEPDEQRIETPRWALDRAGALAREMVDSIAASGVRVVGDLEGLTQVPPGPVDDEPPDVRITPGIAASAAMGVLFASGLARETSPDIPLAYDVPEEGAPDRGGYVPRPSVEPLALARIPTRQVISVLRRRTRAAVGARLYPIRRRIP